MEKLFIFIAALLLCGSGIAQNNPEVRYRQCIQCSNDGLDATSSSTLFTYDTSKVYLTNLIADDYGPRQNDNDMYDWHGGSHVNEIP